MANPFKAAEYLERAETHKSELMSEVEKRNQLEADFSSVIEEKESLQSVVEEKTAQTQQLAEKVEQQTKQIKQLESEVITNFEGVFNEVNNRIYPNSKNIMQIPVVLDCVDLISGSIAQMPIYLYKENSNGERVEIENDNRIKLLNRAPNKHLSAYNFKKNLVRDYLIEGAGYASIEKTHNEFEFTVDELHFLPKSNLNITTRKAGYKTIGAKFDVTADGEGIQTKNVIDTLSEDRVLCITNNYKNPYQGIGVLENGREVFERALQEDRFIKSIYLNGAIIKGILTTEQRLSKIATENLKSQFDSIYAGGSNANKTAVFQEGLKYQPLSMSPVDMQLNEAKKTTSTEICQLFNVPESMINSTANKYGSIEENNLHFLKYCLGPILSAIESSCNMSLLDDVEKEEGYYFEFDVEELSRATESERIASLSEGVSKGLFTSNEVRQKLGYKRTTGGDALKFNLGDIFLDSETGEWTVPNMDGGTKTEVQKNE